MVSAVQVMEQLRHVAEPCSLAMRNPTNIVDMGLVDAIEISDGDVRVTLCLTDPACIHYAGMKRYISDALLALKGVKAVEVRQVLDKLWTPDRVREQRLRFTAPGA
jgi:metal-sulfur cluster biosynthetic enzyme